MQVSGFWLFPSTFIFFHLLVLSADVRKWLGSGCSSCSSGQAVHVVPQNALDEMFKNEAQGKGRRFPHGALFLRRCSQFKMQTAKTCPNSNSESHADLLSNDVWFTLRVLDPELCLFSFSSCVYIYIWYVHNPLSSCAIFTWPLVSIGGRGPQPREKNPRAEPLGWAWAQWLWRNSTGSAFTDCLSDPRIKHGVQTMGGPRHVQWASKPINSKPLVSHHHVSRHSVVDVGDNSNSQEWADFVNFVVLHVCFWNCLYSALIQNSVFQRPNSTQEGTKVPQRQGPRWLGNLHFTGDVSKDAATSHRMILSFKFVFLCVSNLKASTEPRQTFWGSVCRSPSSVSLWHSMTPIFQGFSCFFFGTLRPPWPGHVTESG
jgi:hypothetical protein